MEQEQLRKETAKQWAEKSKCEFTFPDSIVLTNQEVDDYGNERATESFIAGAEWEAEREKWIDVEDALPDNNKFCLILLNGHNNTSHHIPYIGSYDVMHKDWTSPFGDDIPEDITHWQALPSPPKTSKQ